MRHSAQLVRTRTRAPPALRPPPTLCESPAGSAPPDGGRNSHPISKPDPPALPTRNHSFGRARRTRIPSGGGGSARCRPTRRRPRAARAAAATPGKRRGAHTPGACDGERGGDWPRLFFARPRGGTVRCVREGHFCAPRARVFRCTTVVEAPACCLRRSWEIGNHRRARQAKPRARGEPD